MPDPVAFAEHVTEGIAEQTVVYLTELDEHLAVSGLVLEAALRLHEGAIDMSVGTIVPDTASLTPVAERLAAIATRSIGMLQSMVDAGAIEAPESILGLTAAPVALAIESGDVAGTTPADTDSAANPDGDDGGNPGDDEDEVTPETFTRQRRVMLDVFGASKDDEIDELTPQEMAYFGELLKSLYMGMKLEGRGVSSQAVRADQFADVMAGMGANELEVKYGQTENAIRQALVRIGREVFPREHSAAVMSDVFDKTLANLRAAGQPV